MLTHKRISNLTIVLDFSNVDFIDFSSAHAIRVSCCCCCCCCCFQYLKNECSHWSCCKKYNNEYCCCCCCCCHYCKWRLFFLLLIQQGILLWYWQLIGARKSFWFYIQYLERSRSSKLMSHSTPAKLTSVYYLLVNQLKRYWNKKVLLLWNRVTFHFIFFEYCRNANLNIVSSKKCKKILSFRTWFLSTRKWVIAWCSTVSGRHFGRLSSTQMPNRSTSFLPTRFVVPQSCSFHTMTLVKFSCFVKTFFWSLVTFEYNIWPFRSRDPINDTGRVRWIGYVR